VVRRCSARGLIEWMCTQERWNPEVAMIFGAAARYRRATVGSSNDDAHPDNSTLHTGAFRPHTGFVESLFFISPRTGHGSSQVFEMLPAFSCISCACAFRAGGDASIFSVDPSRQREALVWLPRRAGSFGISWRIHFVVKKTLHRHRAGFEPQHASPFMSSQVKLILSPKQKSKTRSKQKKDMHKCSSVYSERGVPLPVLTSGGE